MTSFAFPPKIGSARFLAKKHPMDVCPLAGRIILSLRLSTRIHPITEWPSLLPSSHPIPPTECLTVSLPKYRGEGIRLPRSTYLTANTLGPLYQPVGVLLVSDVLQPLRTTHLPFGSGITAIVNSEKNKGVNVWLHAGFFK